MNTVQRSLSLPPQTLQLDCPFTSCMNAGELAFHPGTCISPGELAFHPGTPPGLPGNCVHWGSVGFEVFHGNRIEAFMVSVTVQSGW